MFLDKVDWLFNIDWRQMFVPQSSILEMVVRGTLMYLGMFVLLRVFRRQAGSVSIADLLLIVIIADAAQNGMAGEAKVGVARASTRQVDGRSTPLSVTPVAFQGKGHWTGLQWSIRHVAAQSR